MYLTPGAISSVTSDSGIVYSWTVPGPTGGSTGSYCALDSAPCAVEPTGVWCAVWSGTVAAAASAVASAGADASGAAGSAAAVAGAGSAGTLDEGLELESDESAQATTPPTATAPTRKMSAPIENGAESGGHRTLLEVRASIVVRGDAARIGAATGRVAGNPQSAAQRPQGVEDDRDVDRLLEQRAGHRRQVARRRRRACRRR